MLILTITHIANISFVWTLTKHNLLKTLSSFQIGKLQVWQDISPYRCSNDHLPKVWSWHGCRSWVRKGIRTKVGTKTILINNYSYLFQVFHTWSHKSKVFTPKIEEDLWTTFLALSSSCKTKWHQLQLKNVLKSQCYQIVCILILRKVLICKLYIFHFIGRTFKVTVI